MSKRVMFVDDGDDTTLEVTPGNGAIRLTVRNFGGPDEEAAFDLSVDDLSDFLSELHAAEREA